MTRLLPLLLSLSLFLLAGCEQPTPNYALDQCQRNAIFERCLKLLPAGPERTKYNDWSEVVDECNDAAREQSYRAPQAVPPTCLAESR